MDKCGDSGRPVLLMSCAHFLSIEASRPLEVDTTAVLFPIAVAGGIGPGTTADLLRRLVDLVVALNRMTRGIIHRASAVGMLRFAGFSMFLIHGRSMPESHSRCRPMQGPETT